MTINVFEEVVTVGGKSDRSYTIDDPRVELPHKDKNQVQAFIQQHFHPTDETLKIHFITIKKKVPRS